MIVIEQLVLCRLLGACALWANPTDEYLSKIYYAKFQEVESEVMKIALTNSLNLYASGCQSIRYRSEF